MDDGVALRVVGDDGGLLVLLGLYSLLGLGLLVLLLLRDLVVLLLVLRRADGCQAGLLTLQLGHDRLQCLGRGGLALVENLLHQRVVGVQHQVERVGHLSVEAHAGLELAHVLHAAHVLVLRDDDGAGLGAEAVDLHHELGLVDLRQLGAEDG